MAAVELEEPTAVSDVFSALRDRGVLARPQARALAFSPPLTVTGEQIGLIGDAMREALDAVLEARGSAAAVAR
jgi:adenosylmethionine-8-amino-7-oxononanoate aminotransferase